MTNRVKLDLGVNNWRPKQYFLTKWGSIDTLDPFFSGLWILIRQDEDTV